MKKFFSILMAVLTIAMATSVQVADAQLVKPITVANADTLLTNNDTAYVTLLFDGSYKSVEAWVEEVSGTTGGTVYFQGKFPHTKTADWTSLDSLTLSDVTTAQYKLFTVPSPRTYAAYRFLFIKSGSGTARISGFYVRYTGGAIIHDDPYRGIASLKSNSPSGDIYLVRRLQLAPTGRLLTI